jgi:hypothetical protein
MEAKLKHLDYIQAAISRMATNSFLFKGWAITLAVGLSAFAAVETRAALLTIALLSTLIFWGLDGYYLWLERGFIKLHYEVAKKAEADIDFSMKLNDANPALNWFKTCWRHHLYLFYGSIIVVDIVGIILIRSK